MTATAPRRESLSPPHSGTHSTLGAIAGSQQHHLTCIVISHVSTLTEHEACLPQELANVMGTKQSLLLLIFVTMQMLPEIDKCHHVLEVTSTQLWGSEVV